jgi:hypothetical protein
LLIAIASSVSCATATFYVPTDTNLIFSSVSCGTPNLAATVAFSNPDIVGHLRLFPGKNTIGVNLQIVFPKNESTMQTIEVFVNSHVVNMIQTGRSDLQADKIGVMYQGELNILPPGKVSVLISPLQGGPVNSGHGIEFELRSEFQRYSCLQ